VSLDPAASDYVAARGGRLWVRSTRRRCCGGTTTWLRATTSSPKDPEHYERLDCGAPVSVFFHAAAGRPDVLEIELRGLLRRPVALWDGCAVKL
jgi:hypothetical protein